MQKLQKEKEALGEPVEDQWLSQFNKVMTVRAYDLLYLQLGQEKADLQAAIKKYRDNKEIKKLIEQDKKYY